MDKKKGLKADFPVTRNITMPDEKVVNIDVGNPRPALEKFLKENPGFGAKTAPSPDRE